MKKIAIIGSGYTGLLSAHALLQKGYKVSLHTDRSAEDWLNNSRPTGTAARFEMALNYERELGLNHWEDLAPKGRGVHLIFSPKDNNTLITLAGKLSSTYFQAVDLRLQSHRWMNDFEEEGGEIHIEKVDIDRLDSISKENDLTLVATGKGQLSELFPRDTKRSVYQKPQRKLVMLNVVGAELGFDGVPYLPVKFNLTAQHGEAFWVPYYHRDHGACWSLVFEIKEGGKLDRFDDCSTGEELVERAKEVIKEVYPYDYDWCKNMKIADEMSWLTGSVLPTVKRSFGKLPSGHVVMPLGDALISMDPIGGQGANLCSKQVQHTVASIIAHEGNYDENWMEKTFEEFWEEHGKATVKFNNAFLEPLTTAGKLLLVSQYGSNGDSVKVNQKIADAVVENFRDPRGITDAFLHTNEAKKLITNITQKPWLNTFVPSLFQIIKGQVRQLVGLDPKHPLCD